MAGVCAIIFLFSADAHSNQHIQRVAGILLSVVGRDTATERMHLRHPVAKLGHIVVYFSLGLVSLAAWSKAGRRPLAGAAWRAWVFCALYACTDEFHQRFVPTRDPTVRDVLLDSAAAAAAILSLAMYWGRQGHGGEAKAEEAGRQAGEIS